jgi:hypothetical protein
VVVGGGAVVVVVGPEVVDTVVVGPEVVDVVVGPGVVDDVVVVDEGATPVVVVVDPGSAVVVVADGEPDVGLVVAAGRDVAGEVAPLLPPDAADPDQGAMRGVVVVVGRAVVVDGASRAARVPTGALLVASALTEVGAVAVLAAAGVPSSNHGSATT